jgi:hypothetical protein
MRRQGVVVSVFIFGSFLILFLVRFNVNRYHSSIQSQMEQQLDRKVTLGDMTLRLLPLRVDVSNPVIWEDPHFEGGPPFIKAESMSLSVSLLALLKNSFEANAVDWERPQVQLIKNVRGEWNLSSLGLPRLKNLRLHEGRVSLTNLQEKKRAVYDHVDLNVGNYVRGQPFSLDVAAYVASRSDENIRLQGKAGPLSQANVLRSPFDGSLSLNQFPIESLNNFLDASTRANLRGTASGRTEIKNENGKVSASGTIKTENLSVKDVDLGYPVTARYTLAEDSATGVIEIPSATVNLGSTSISVTGSVDPQSAPAELSLNVSASRASAAEVTRLAAALGVGFRPDITISGEMSGNVQVQGPVRTPALNGTVVGRDLRAAGSEIPQPVEIAAIDVAITPTIIQSNEFEIKTGRTRAVSHFVLEKYVSGSPFIDFTLRSNDAELRDVRSIARVSGLKGLARMDGSGALNLNLHARGTMRGIRSSEIVKLLGGNAGVSLNNVHITGTHFSKGLFPKVGQHVEIERVSGTFQLDRGAARTNDLRVTLNIGNVVAAGIVDLENEIVHLRVTAILSAVASKQVESSGPGGIIAGLGKNRRGELTVPGVVSGTFDNPKFQPDKEQIALSRLKGSLPKSENPGGLLGSIIGHGGSDKQSVRSAPRRLKPAAHARNRK